MPLSVRSAFKSFHESSTTIRLWAANGDRRDDRGWREDLLHVFQPPSPNPSHHGERLCAKCAEARQPLRDVYMSFMLRDGWNCQFLEADLPRNFAFATPEKVVELVERGRGLKDLASKQALEHGIQTGRGGINLHLTPDRYNKLKKADLAHSARC